MNEHIHLFPENSVCFKLCQRLHVLGKYFYIIYTMSIFTPGYMQNQYCTKRILFSVVDRSANFELPLCFPFFGFGQLYLQFALDHLDVLCLPISRIP